MINPNFARWQGLGFSFFGYSCFLNPDRSTTGRLSSPVIFPEKKGTPDMIKITSLPDRNHSKCSWHGLISQLKEKINLVL